MIQTQTDPDLILKATPSRTRKPALHRSRLSLRSIGVVDKTLLTLHAPAGFGKTQLMLQWRNEWLETGGLVIWLSLDERDIPLKLAQGLAVAKAVACGKHLASDSAPQRISQDTDELGQLTSWLAEVAELTTETLLILDDAHNLPADTVRHSLPYLLYNAPANLHVAIASRASISLPISELLSNGLSRTVGISDLRLTLDETLALLAARFEQRLQLDDAVRLHELTEGWPLGLQVTISALEQTCDLHGSTQELVTGGGNLQEHLVDWLLACLSSEQRDFLTRISLFEMVHPDLCVSLFEDQRAATLLQEVFVSTPILSASIDGEWLRIHPMARELLFLRFAALPEGERQTLHKRACEWLANHALFEAAARQALLAGQSAQAYDLAEKCLYELMLRGHFDRVLDWLEKLPSEEIDSRPRLRLAAAWSLSVSERQAEAVVLAEQISADAQNSVDEQMEAAAIICTAAFFADHLDRTVEILSPWLEHIDAAPIIPKQALTNHRASHMLRQGHPELARKYCQQMQLSIVDTDFDALAGYRDWVVGLSYFWEGQILSAEKALRASSKRADQMLGRRSSISVLLATTLAAVLFERDATVEAATVLANRIDVLAERVAPEGIMFGYLTAARLASLQGQDHRAHDFLNELYALGEFRQMPRLSITAQFEQIRLHAMRDHGETCQSLWFRLERGLPNFVREERGLLGRELALYVHLGHAFSAVARHAWHDARQPLEQAARLADEMRRGREAIQVKLLQAMAHQRLSNDGLHLLREAKSLAEERGLQRILLDTHPDLPAWVETIEVSSARASAARVQLSRDKIKRSVGVSCSQMLTPKEREIIHLLTHRMSNKEIAVALNIGEETIKWHMKNLLSKFQVGNRRHLVDRAYLLGIL